MNVSRILVVDDNCDLTDGLAMVLEDKDYQVTVAYTGEAAVSESHKRAFDLVLMDFKLPGINGLEAIRRIHEERPDTRAIIMTGFRLEQLLSEVAGPGMVCIVRPPITGEKLLKALETVQPQGIILVISAGSFATESIEEVLSAAGRRITVARNSVEVREARGFPATDALLLDLGLPLIRNLEALSEAGASGGPSVSIIIVDVSTSDAPSGNALQSRAVTGCFFKPFELDELLEAVEACCGGPGETSTQRGFMSHGC